MSLNPKYCGAFITPEGCPLGKKCPKRHNICRCTCEAVLALEVLEAHKKGKKHMKALESLADSQGAGSTPIPTKVKKRPPKTFSTRPAHSTLVSSLSLHSKISKLNISSQFNGPPPTGSMSSPPEAGESASLRCETCNKMIPVIEVQTHMEEHERKRRVADIQAKLAEAQSDKNGITVTPAESIDFGVIDHPDGTSQSFIIEISIRRTGGNGRISLSNFSIASSHRRDEHGTK